MITQYPAFLLFSKPFFTDIICSQSLRRENFTITLPLFFLSLWHASRSRGESSHPIFWKTVSTLSSNSLLLTLLRIPTYSMHSLVEYWAIAQHCLSISTKRLNNKVFACFTTTFSDSGWLNLSFNLQISSSIKSFFSVSLLWSDITIPISSLLFNLSKTSSVYVIAK